MTVEQVYEQDVRVMARKDRLKLASLILRDLTNTADSDSYSDEWSEEDLKELTVYSLRYAAEVYPEREELV